VLVALLGACSKNIQNPEAVKAGVLEYLDQRSAQIGLSMAAMDVTVSSLTFEKDTVRANVSFHPKGALDAGGMSRQYVLDRSGNKWVVNATKSGAITLSAPDGSLQPVPTGAMPPGHPGVNSAGEPLPSHATPHKP
jgi:hypothetical protein